MKHLVAVIVLLFLASTVLADGGTYVRYSYSKDTLSLIPEDRQYAYIAEENGFEELQIAVKSSLNGSEAFWILPLPAESKDVSVDVLRGFPDFTGYEVKSRVGYSVNQAYPWMVMTQVYPIILLFPLQFGIFNMGGGGGGTSVGAIQDSGIRVETHLEKKGLTVEVLEADSGNALDNYLKGKNVKLPEESRSIVGEYVGKRYSFVVVWISNVEEYRKSAGGDSLSLQAKFPTDRLYYPLRLTAVYGQRKIPVHVYFKDFVTPEVYNSIEGMTQVGYYVNKDGMQYTKVFIRAPAYSFTEDLWGIKNAPLDATIAYLLGFKWGVTPLLVFIFCSCLAAVIAGFVVYQREFPLRTYVKVGLHNFLTIFGVSYAANRMLMSGGKSRSNKTLSSILITMPFIAVLAFVLSTSLLGPILGLYDQPYEYHASNLLLIERVLYFLGTNIIYLAIAAATIYLYKKGRGRAWLIPAAWFGLLVLIGIMDIFKRPISDWNTWPIIAPIISLLVFSLLIMLLAGLLLNFSDTKPGKFCIVFSVLFVVLVLVTSFTVMAIFPPKVTVGGGMIATGFAKIKPQLAGTGLNSNGEFLGVFTNGVGTKISIKDVSIEDANGEFYCGGYVVNGTVSAGENVRVHAYDCIKGQPGDIYNMKVMIEYDVTVGSITTTHTETGTLRGSLE